MEKTLSKLINKFPKYGDLYHQKVNNKDDISIQEEFCKMNDEIDNLSNLLVNHIGKMSIEEKLLTVTLCYNELNKLDRSIVVVLVPTLKKLKEIALFHILQNEGDITSWNKIKEKMEGLIRM